MDLIGIGSLTMPRARAEIAVTDTVVPMGGGTWLYSETQPDVTGLVDLTALGWTPWEPTEDDGVSIAATCTLAQLTRIPQQNGWRALTLFRQCAESLLASFKVWNVATVGGNIGASLAAGAMISLTSTLDADLVLWGAGDRERRVTVADFVLAQQTNTRASDEVIRSIEIGGAAMRARTGFRRIALSALGRAGTVVCARRDESGAFVVSVTGGTTRPNVFRFATLPSAVALGAAVDTVDTWFTDAHGAADWRRAMSLRFAEELREELA